jgi:hypothetical protein
VAKQEFRTSDGQVYILDDEITALGPHPDLSGTSAAENNSYREAYGRFVPITELDVSRGVGKPRCPRGYGITPEMIQEYKVKLRAWEEQERVRLKYAYRR